MKQYIGVDIGGTNIVLGLVNERGDMIKLNKTPTEAQKGSHYVVHKLAGMIQEMIVHGPVPGRFDVAAVGMGIPGFVDRERGISVGAVNLGWRHVPVAGQLSSVLGGLPVFIDNDVRMYVYGEAMAGAGRAASNVLGITLGTGLAAAVVNDGKLYYGSGNRAGELGHMIMEGIHNRCNCGKTGCLETVASATGIARQAREALQRGEPSVLRQWFPQDGFEAVTAADVSKGYDEGDRLCRNIMAHTGTLLGKALGFAVILYSPDMIVIGGGAAQAGERLFAPMREALKKSVDSTYWDALTIKRAEHEVEAGVIGSALYARNRLVRSNGSNQ